MDVDEILSLWNFTALSYSKVGKKEKMEFTGLLQKAGRIQHYINRNFMK